MDCREAFPLISPYLDEELPGDKRAALLEHTASCQACAYELFLQESLCATLKNMAGDIQAPPELCGMVMNGVAKQRRGFLRVLSPRLQRVIAAAATVLIMAGGSAGLTVALKTDAGSKMIGYYNTPPAITEPAPVISPVPEGDGSTSPGQNSTIPPATGGKSFVAQGQGTGTGGAPQTGSTNEEPQAAASNGLNSNSSNILGVAGTSAVEGPRVFLNTEIKVDSTVMTIAVDELDAARAKAVSLAIDAGAVAHVYPEQNNGKNMLYMRLKVAPEQSAKLIDGLNSLGVVIDRQDESKDITSIYNETLVNYNSLQYLKSVEADDSVKQQLEAQATSCKQQLDTWTEEAGSRVINLWLESEN